MMVNKIKKFLSKYNFGSWIQFIVEEVNKKYFRELMVNVISGYENDELFPNQINLFRAIESVRLEDVKVVIIGQDPYFNDNQANGLAFSVNLGTKTPPSLQNIFVELNNEFGAKERSSDLIEWCKQGVLLLNTIMTVKKYKPLSCQKWGWQEFSYNLIKHIITKTQNVVIMCFGNYAKNFVKQLIDDKHCFLMTSHPSPLSANSGFLGSGVFVKANNYLTYHNKVPIKW